MPHQLPPSVLAVGLAAALLAVPLQAQVVRPVPDAAGIAKMLRTTGEAGPAMRALTGALGPLSRQQIDAIADSMTAFVISSPGDRGSRAESRSVALRILMGAGMGNGGVRYPGAAERLLRIAENARDAGDRGGAIIALTQLPDKAQTLRMLRRVAVSPENPAAVVAVQELWGSFAELGGIETLRDLDRDGLVTERGARRELDFVARKFGWR